MLYIKLPSRDSDYASNTAKFLVELSDETKRQGGIPPSGTAPEIPPVPDNLELDISDEGTPSFNFRYADYPCVHLLLMVISQGVKQMLEDKNIDTDHDDIVYPPSEELRGLCNEIATQLRLLPSCDSETGEVYE